MEEWDDSKSKIWSGIVEAWQNNWRPVTVVVTLMTVLVSIGCAIYWYHFPYGISKEKSDWYYFSTYIMAVIAFLNLLVFAILSYLIYRYNARSANNQVHERVLHEKPIVIFSYSQHFKCYSIQNIGKGAALNVEIKSNLKGSKWQVGYIWSSLPSKSEVEQLNWTTDTKELCATYWDSFENRYVSYMENNVLHVINVGDTKSERKHPNELTKGLHPAQALTWRP